jgi:hypothetical protein
MTIIYQYKHTEQNEYRLRYSIRSLQNLGGWENLHIVGDKPRILKPDSYKYIKSPTDPRITLEERTYDRCAKMERVLEVIDRPDFVILYDDMYFIKEVSILRYCRPIARAPLGDEGHLKVYGSVHEKNVIRTLESLREAGKPSHNYETHLPRMYNWIELMNVMDEWQVKQNRYLPSTIYFNTQHEKPREVIDRDSELILAVYGFEGTISHHIESERDLDKKAEGRYMLNTGPQIPRKVREWLEKRFPHKSELEI